MMPPETSSSAAPSPPPSASSASSASWPVLIVADDGTWQPTTATPPPHKQQQQQQCWLARRSCTALIRVPIRELADPDLMLPLPTLTARDKDDDGAVVEGHDAPSSNGASTNDVFLSTHRQNPKGGAAAAAHHIAVAARSALADYVARALTVQSNAQHGDEVMEECSNEEEFSFRIETLDRRQQSRSDDSSSHRGGIRGGDDPSRQRRRRRRRRGDHPGAMMPPFVLDRTDVYCCSREDDNSNSNNKNKDGLFLNVHVRVLASRTWPEGSPKGFDDDDDAAFQNALAKAVQLHMGRLVQGHRHKPELLRHLATAVFQERLRHQLEHGDGDGEKGGAVAFVANGSVLPRKNGNSSLPMASPPAVPFRAPASSPMTATLQVPMGKLARYLQLPHTDSTDSTTEPSSPALVNGSNVVQVTGLLIPRGVTLIVGGGYHGKSTLLRALSVGVHNKVPGDGREFCVTVESAVSIRAEDGRYVNNCNVSAFITNLPKIGPPKQVRDDTNSNNKKENESNTSSSANANSTAATKHFSTGEASGSTSQAANVCEAIEMGASAMLVDEDVSAANFMARDGRMRSLVADESITPLLYRVNGMYSALGISSVVVVGGVGDWLDVPDAVVLMQNYECFDATTKARSISRQFSHGHVQYAGRGVVHRLPWDKSGSSVPLPPDAPPPKHTPVPRRPTDAFCQLLQRDRTEVRLLDGSEALAFDPVEYDDDEDDDGDSRMTHALDHDDGDDDDGEYVVDMSRCEQLVGKKMQLYGCGLCALFVLELARSNPGVGLADLLRMMDEHLDRHGLASLVDRQGDPNSTLPWNEAVLDRLGFAYRPRRFEVGQALTRLRGIKLQEIQVEDDGSEAAARAEAERKRQEMLDMWNSRRKNKA
jgi:Predicted ATPase of the ABC class